MTDVDAAALGTTDAAPGRWPLVSVVLPTRGRPELLRSALAGVLEQTYAGPLECIIVHDQEEPERALESLSTPGRRVRVVSNTGAPGLAGARNCGLTHTSGDFIASCDDDDRWHATKLTRQMAWLEEHPDYLVVGAGIRLLMPAGPFDWPGQTDTITHADLLLSRYKELHSSTLLIRREAFEQAGGYDENLPFSYGEDYEWLLRVSRVGGVGVVTEPLADIKKDGSSWFRERQTVVAEALQYLLEQHPEFRESRRGESRLLGQIAFAYATLGQRRLALRWAGRALRRWPLAPHALLAIVMAITRLDPRHVLTAARARGRGIS
jgi:glycosyltransferase involved in cell wall biosynthesis